MGTLDRLNKQGGAKSKDRTYINKDEPVDATLRVREMALRVSENPNTEGDEIAYISFEVVEDRAGNIEVAADGSVNLVKNLDKGKKAAQERTFEELAEALAPITGTPFVDIMANPLLVRELMEEVDKYKGVEVIITSKAPKNNYYNHRWETQADYDARMAKVATATAKRQRRGAPADEQADEQAPEVDEQPAEQPKSTKRPKTRREPVDELG